jgi:cell division protein ZipA
MNDLRIFLLIIGAAIVTGIYVWGTIKERNRQRQQTVAQLSPNDEVANIKLDSSVDSDIDYSSVLAGLSKTISGSKQDSELQASDAIYQEDDLVLKNTTLLSSTETPSPEDVKLAAGNNENENLAAAQIVTLHVIPRGNDVIDGKSILKAVAEIDLQFGVMNIFHHFGVGEMKAERAIFSMANMLEPGSFDMTQIESFSTRGLVLFMPLPAVIDAQVVFELMLNSAQRLAELLGADVCDENRLLINEQKIESIRNLIAAN